MHRIEICGGIASGKTTLTQLISNTGIVSVLEDFRANPFWKPFYADPAGTAFETEITFLLQHYHEIKVAAKQCKPFVCDFSPLLDRAYSHVTLDKEKQSAFAAVYSEVRNELSSPKLLIHLICDPSIELDRVRRRGRDIEKAITTQYLQAINRALNELVNTTCTSWKVLSVDSGLVDFAENEKDKLAVLAAIQRERDLPMTT